MLYTAAEKHPLHAITCYLLRNYYNHCLRMSKETKEGAIILKRVRMRSGPTSEAHGGKLSDPKLQE